MPALAKFIAMPPPMVPAPMIAADLIGRLGVSSGTSGILEAARSPKKKWRSALLSVVCISARKFSRSTSRPSSNFMLAAAATQSTHFSGAGKFFDIAPTVLRANWKKASWLG